MSRRVIYWRVEAGGHVEHPDKLSLTSATRQMPLDEVVIDKWLHVERMGDNEWDVHVGDEHFFVTVDRYGNAKKIVDQRA